MLYGSELSIHFQNLNDSRNLNQIKAALLIEDRGLSTFNNLAQEDVRILQRLRVSRTEDRDEFMSIFVEKLFGIQGNFPTRLSCKLYLVIDKVVADIVVLAQQTANGGRLTTVHDTLAECGLGGGDTDAVVLCQGVSVNTSTPLYFLRETALQVDGFIHLVYKIQSNT